MLVWVDPLFTGKAAGMTVWGFCAGESNSLAGARHHGWRIVSRSGSMGDAALLACDVHVMPEFLGNRSPFAEATPRRARRAGILSIGNLSIGNVATLACGCRKLNPAILVMQSAQDWATKNARQMRAGSIVIFHIRQQQVTEVALAEHNNVVKAFPADRTDQPLSISIAKGSAATSVDRECPLIEAFG